MLREKRDAGTVSSLRDHFAKPLRKIFFLRLDAFVLEATRAIRVIQIEQRCLALNIGRALARCVIRISLHLRRTTIMRHRHQRMRSTAMRTRRCIENRLAGNAPLHALCERHQRLLLAAARTQRKTRQRRTRSHVFQKAPATHLGVQLRRSGLKLLVLPVLEVRRLRQLTKATPILRAIALLLRMLENVFAHR